MTFFGLIFYALNLVQPQLMMTDAPYVATTTMFGQVISVPFGTVVEGEYTTGVWTDEMQRLAMATETEHKLPSGTCRAFALQESNYDPFALRAEIHYIDKTGSYYTRIKNEAYAFAKARNFRPSYYTELVQRGESHGMFQIMGVNLRADGYSKPFFGSLYTLKEQFKSFGVFISRLLRKHKGKLDYSASEYNGGSGAVRGGNFRNGHYVNNIIRYQKQFSKFLN